MTKYRVKIVVKEVRGQCAAGYKDGDTIIAERFYIIPQESAKICLHALSAMQTILSAFLHGTSARELGIGEKDDVGYLQCPDPGPPLTKGGTVIFELKREPMQS